MASKLITTRIYRKPLVPDQAFSKDVTASVLQKTRTDLLRRIKRKLTQTTFSDRAKKALAKALLIEVKPSSLVITVNHPAYGPLTRGQSAGQMKWLGKATRPIPIVTEGGKVIFRNASAKSMADGKWRHPGRPPSDFVKTAKEESKVFLKKKFRKELVEQVRAAWKK